MNLLLDWHVHRAERSRVRKQCITLKVAASDDRLDLDLELVRAVLAGTRGVEMIEADADHERVWVFGDGTVETEDLLGALAWWGYDARVLNNELNLAE
jgi:hypothetical protein